MTNTNSAAHPPLILPPLSDHLSHHGILSLAEVKVLLGRSRSGIYAAMNPRSPYFQPGFPKRVKLSARRVGWRTQDVLTYLEGLEVVRENGDV